MAVGAPQVVRKSSFRETLLDYSVLLGLGVLFVIGVIMAPAGFGSPASVFDILNAGLEPMFLTMGITAVLMAGEFDLSFPNQVGMASVVVAVLYNRMSGILPIIVVILAGLAFGALNAVLVGYVGLPSFFATIASGSMAYGIGLHLCNDGKPVVTYVPYALEWLRTATIGPIPNALLLLIAVVLVFKGFIEGTRAGQEVYACGDAPIAARAVGINVLKSKMVAFMLSGVAAGIVGVFVTTKAGSGIGTIGPRLMLPVLAGTFLGATMFTKKRFTILGAAVGVLFVQVLNAVLVYLGYPFYFQDVITGIVLLLGVLGSLAKAKFV